MAGDWIKMECCLHEKPEVAALAARLKTDPFTVVGRLHRLWSWFSAHTESGAADISTAFLDGIVALPGFADALADVRWLEARNGRVSLPNWDRHMSSSAKARALSAARMKRARERDVTPVLRCERNISATREEKRREEKKQEPPPPPRDELEEIWRAYPERGRTGHRGARAAITDALRAIVSAEGHPGASDPPGWLLGRVMAFSASPKGRGPYVPAIARWMRDGHYDDADGQWRDGDKEPDRGLTPEQVMAKARRA